MKNLLAVFICLFLTTSVVQAEEEVTDDAIVAKECNGLFNLKPYAGDDFNRSVSQGRITEALTKLYGSLSVNFKTMMKGKAYSSIDTSISYGVLAGNIMQFVNQYPELAMRLKVAILDAEVLSVGAETEESKKEGWAKAVKDSCGGDWSLCFVFNRAYVYTPTNSNSEAYKDTYNYAMFMVPLLFKQETFTYFPKLDVEFNTPLKLNLIVAIANKDFKKIIEILDTPKVINGTWSQFLHCTGDLGVFPGKQKDYQLLYIKLAANLAEQSKNWEFIKDKDERRRAQVDEKLRQFEEMYRQKQVKESKK